MTASVFVLSACSGDKAIDDPTLDCGDIDRASQAALLDTHAETAMPAESLYTGAEHTHVKAAVEQLAAIADVEWRIISAGFGLVRPETDLPAYECTFRDADAVLRRVERFGDDPSALTRAERIETVAAHLGIPSAIEETLATGFDVAFVVLGRDYLLATGSALASIPGETTAFAFAAKGTRELIGECRWVPATETERTALNTVWTELKGRQLRNVGSSITSGDELLALQTADKVQERSLDSSA